MKLKLFLDSYKEILEDFEETVGGALLNVIHRNVVFNKNISHFDTPISNILCEVKTTLSLLDPLGSCRAVSAFYRDENYLVEEFFSSLEVVAEKFNQAEMGIKVKVEIGKGYLRVIFPEGFWEEESV